MTGLNRAINISLHQWPPSFLAIGSLLSHRHLFLCPIVTKFSSQWIAYNSLMNLSGNNILILIEESNKLLRPIALVPINGRKAVTVIDVGAVLLQHECASEFPTRPVKMPVGGPHGSAHPTLQSSLIQEVWGGAWESEFVTSSHQFPGVADAVGTGTTPWEQLQYHVPARMGKGISGTPFREVTPWEGCGLSQYTLDSHPLPFYSFKELLSFSKISRALLIR